MAEETSSPPPTQKTGLTCSTGDLLVNLPCALLTLVSSVIPDVASAFSSMLNSDMADKLNKNLKGVTAAPDPLMAFQNNSVSTTQQTKPPKNTVLPTIVIPSNIIKGVRLASGWSIENPTQLVTRLKNAGCNLIGFDIMENIVETQGDIAIIQQQQIDKLIPFKAACDAAEVKFEISTSASKFANFSNAIITTQLLKDRYAYAASKLGKDIYVQPISGDAYSLRVNSTQVRLFANTLFTHTIQYAGSGVLGEFLEINPISYTLPTDITINRQTYVVTSSPYLIADTTDLTKLTTFALNSMSKGVSFILYGSTAAMSDALVSGIFRR